MSRKMTISQLTWKRIKDNIQLDQNRIPFHLLNSVDIILKDGKILRSVSEEEYYNTLKKIIDHRLIKSIKMNWNDKLLKKETTPYVENIMNDVFN